MATKRRRGGKGGKGGKAGGISPDVNGEDNAVEEETSAEDAIEVEGTVIEQLRNATFRVDIGSGHMALAHTSGKMRKFRIRIMPGDRVVVALSPYDLSRGRIVYRHK